MHLAPCPPQPVFWYMPQIHVPQVPPQPVPTAAPRQCRFGAGCNRKTRGCPDLHPVELTPSAPQPQPQLTLHEKAAIIHKVKTLSTKCKHNLSCFTYGCVYKHDTVSGLSPKANEILDLVRELNKLNEEIKETPTPSKKGQDK